MRLSALSVAELYLYLSTRGLPQEGFPDYTLSQAGSLPFSFGAMFGGHADFVGEAGAAAANLATADFTILFVAAKVSTRFAEIAVNLLDFFIATDRPTCGNPTSQCCTIAKRLRRQASL